LLFLGLNSISSKGAEILGNGLKSNGRLTHLNLSMNNIEDDGVPGFIKALEGNCTLISLNLGISV